MAFVRGSQLLRVLLRFVFLQGRIRSSRLERVASEAERHLVLEAIETEVHLMGVAHEVFYFQQIVRLLKRHHLVVLSAGVLGVSGLATVAHQGRLASQALEAGFSLKLRCGGNAQLTQLLHLRQEHHRLTHAIFGSVEDLLRPNVRPLFNSLFELFYTHHFCVHAFVFCGHDMNDPALRALERLFVVDKFS
jgi:hypothetical protein